MQALIDAGLPPGVVNIVAGLGPNAGAPLLEHPDVRAISFTGSSEIGSLVGQRAAANFKPVSLEMGGKNAQIVLERCESRSGIERRVVGSVWNDRPALHRDQPHSFAEGHRGRVHRGVCGAREELSRWATVLMSPSKWGPR